IGLVIGAVVAIALTLFKKNYFNVGQSNAACQQVLEAWSKYLEVQGHVAGRALGWPTMVVVFHGATGAGLFPGNDMHLSFHEGTLQCAGHGDWADDFLGMDLNGHAVNNCGAHNCMADALAKYTQERGSIPKGSPDAVYFVDEILLPMNQSAAIPWIYRGGQNPQVHQMLYDLADAYLGAKASGTTPYVEYPASQVASEATPGAVGIAPAAPASSPAAPGAVAPATVPYVSPSASSTAATPASSSALTVTGTTAAGTPVVPTGETDSLIKSLLSQGQSQQQAFEGALASLQANGVQATPQVQQQVAGAVAAAAPVSSSSILSGPTGWILIALGLGGAVFFGMREGHRR
ncbi:MAG: hypothetical protein ACREJ2_11740, partial [Planctomycetota bacterium]